MIIWGVTNVFLFGFKAYPMRGNIPGTKPIEYNENQWLPFWEDMGYCMKVTIHGVGQLPRNSETLQRSPNQHRIRSLLLVTLWTTWSYLIAEKVLCSQDREKSISNNQEMSHLLVCFHRAWGYNADCRWRNGFNGLSQHWTSHAAISIACNQPLGEMTLARQQATF